MRTRPEVGLRERRAFEQRLGVTHEHQCGVGEAHTAPCALEQLHAGLTLEHGQLLRDGRGRELERVRHRGNRASLVQLAQ